MVSYELGYRELGSTGDWTTFSLTEPEYTIFGLEICKEYEIRVRSICDFALGAYDVFVQKTGCLTGAEEAQAGIFEWNVFPNPFHENAKVDFILAKPSPVTMQVMNLTGQVVFSKSFGEMSAGPSGRWSTG